MRLGQGLGAEATWGPAALLNVTAQHVLVSQRYGRQSVVADAEVWVADVVQINEFGCVCRSASWSF